jgi:type IV pilus assembly protein PilN
MPRINLLPWREKQRLRRRNQFFAGLAGGVVAAGLVIGLANWIMSGIIANQNERNDLLKAEIAQLDKKIAEILDLEASKDRLLARMAIIEQLQRSRPEIVHVIKQSGKRLEIRGNAESNTRVSAFMRNIDRSKWLTQPDLQVVEVKEAGGRPKRGLPQETGTFVGRSSEFVVYANQVSASEDSTEADVTPARGGRQSAGNRAARPARATRPPK